MPNDQLPRAQVRCARGRSSGAYRTPAVVGMLGLAGVATLQLTTTSGAAASAHIARPAAKAALKPELAYFAGKTITFINGSSPESGGDSYARPIAPYIAQYLGAAAVNVEPGGDR